jgi:hypothetical protein
VLASRKTQGKVVVSVGGAGIATSS